MGKCISRMGIFMREISEMAGCQVRGCTLGRMETNTSGISRMIRSLERDI